MSKTKQKNIIQFIKHRLKQEKWVLKKRAKTKLSKGLCLMRIGIYEEILIHNKKLNELAKDWKVNNFKELKQKLKEKENEQNRI